MSMHEIEDVVEASIRILAARGADRGLDLRSAFHALYKFQELFDTGFTHFRVLDLLIEHRYTYKFPVERHPEYERQLGFFEELEGFAFLNLNPEAPWDREENPVAGYYEGGFLYCDAGSPLWAAFVESGVLEGKDGIPPSELPFSELVAQILRLAEEDQDRTLIRMWFPLFILGVLHLGPWTVESLKEDAHVRTIRGITRRTKALDIEMDYGACSIPNREEVKGSPVLDWWFYAGLECGEGEVASEAIRAPKAGKELSQEQAKRMVEALREVDMEGLKALIEGGISPNALLPLGETPLHGAAHHPQGVPVIRYLLQRGADPNPVDFTGMTPLMYAARWARPENVRLLLEAGAQVDRQSMGGVSALMEALSIETASQDRDEQELSAQVLEIVENLIDAGAEVNLAATWGDTALHRAVKSASLPIVKRLLQAGAEVNAAVKDPDSMTQPPLHTAVAGGEAQIVQLLLEAGGDPDMQDNHGLTPLMEAIRQDRLDLVKMICDYGCDPSLEDRAGDTALFHAIRRGQPEILAFLIDTYGTLNQGQGRFQLTPLMWACARGAEVERVDFLVGRGADPLAEDAFGRTPLSFALASGNQAIVEWYRERFPDQEYRLPGQLGILLYETEAQGQAALKQLGVGHGVAVRGILSDSAAQQAGLRVDDVVLAIDGKEIRDRADLMRRMRGRYEGEEARCTVQRAGERITVELKLRAPETRSVSRRR